MFVPSALNCYGWRITIVTAKLIARIHILLYFIHIHTQYLQKRICLVVEKKKEKKSEHSRKKQYAAKQQRRKKKHIQQQQATAIASNYKGVKLNEQNTTTYTKKSWGNEYNRIKRREKKTLKNNSNNKEPKCRQMETDKINLPNLLEQMVGRLMCFMS